MEQITGNENNFPTIKQVNAALADIKMLGGTVYVETYDKENLGKALELALADVDDGTTIDCTYFKGKQTITSGFNVTKSVQLIFGDVDITFRNPSNSNLFNIQTNNVIIKGQNRNADKNSIYNGSTIFRMVNPDISNNTGYHIYSRGNKNIIIQDMTLIGVKTTLGRQFDNSTYPIDGCGGIYIEKAKPEITEGGNTVNAIRLQNLLIDRTKVHGIYLDTPILSLIKDVRISSCAGHGIFINGGTTTLLESVYISSAQLAGFCIYGHTYGTLLNCVAEYCGCGFWIRSSFNVSLFNPGIEHTNSYGNNPWKNSQPISGYYGFNQKTKASNNTTNINISDINQDTYNYFIGNGFIISGGRNISLYGPYCTSIGNSIAYEVYPNGTEKSKNLRYFIIDGNNRSSYIMNAGLKDDNNAYQIISNEIEIGSDVKSLELVYDVRNTTLQNYTSSTPVTNDKTLTAPILCLSDDVMIRNGKTFYTEPIFESDTSSNLPIVEINDAVISVNSIESFGNIIHYRGTVRKSQFPDNVIDSSNVALTAPNSFLCTINNIHNLTSIENTTFLFVKQNIKKISLSKIYTSSFVNTNGDYFNLILTISNNVFSNLIIEYFMLKQNDTTKVLDFYGTVNVLPSNIIKMSATIPGFIVFNISTNTFLLETSESKFYGGWSNQTFFGTPTQNGVVPFESQIYKESSTGKYYIGINGTLVEGNN